MTRNEATSRSPGQEKPPKFYLFSWLPADVVQK